MPRRKEPGKVWKLARLIAEPVFKWAFGLKVEGREHLPNEGVYIVAPNHRTYWDPPIVAAAMYPHEPFFLAKEEVWTETPWFGVFISHLNAIPIRRQSGGKDAIKMALNILKEGDYPLVVFPEGTRNREPWKRKLLPLKLGTALIAIRMRVPVVPAWIVGVPSRWIQWFLREKPLKVRLGRPIDTRRYADSRKGWRDFTKRLEVEMLKLAEEP